MVMKHPDCLHCAVTKTMNEYFSERRLTTAPAQTIIDAGVSIVVSAIANAVRAGDRTAATQYAVDTLFESLRTDTPPHHSEERAH